MSQMPQVRFGTFEFDVDALELRRQGTRVSIEPQPAKALALLAARAGEVVTREELKQALWNGDVNVDFDRGIAYVIAQVRSALGDSADNPRFVETLPKRGFRFIAPVTAGSKDPASEKSYSPEPAATPWLKALIASVVIVGAVAWMLAWQSEHPVLAVAIFDNETGQSQYDQFTSGMADAVIGRLGKLDLDRLGLIGNARSLRMPRSTRDLNQIKSETGASFILISGLRTQDDGVRLLSQLIRLRDGRHVWVQSFDRPAGALAGLEEEVLAAVETGVRTRILGEPAPSPAPASR